MKSPQSHAKGLIAILDAMGTASYGVAEIARFMKSREIVIGLVREKAEATLSPKHLNVFTFNDTILFSLTAENAEPTLREVSAFYQLLRKFMIDSLSNGILFRGSIAAGTFYADKDSNTIMGEAVTDAAAWYSQADWIGIHATPRTTLLIDALLKQRGDDKNWVMIDYPVPIKDSTPLCLKAVNWPKAFFVSELVSADVRWEPQATALKWLGSQPIPKGAESKCVNAMEFFQFVVKTLDLKTPSTTKQKSPKKAGTRKKRVR